MSTSTIWTCCTGNITLLAIAVYQFFRHSDILFLLKSRVVDLECLVKSSFLFCIVCDIKYLIS